MSNEFPDCPKPLTSESGGDAQIRIAKTIPKPPNQDQALLWGQMTDLQSRLGDGSVAVVNPIDKADSVRGGGLRQNRLTSPPEQSP